MVRSLLPLLYHACGHGTRIEARSSGRQGTGGFVSIHIFNTVSWGAPSRGPGQSHLGLRAAPLGRLASKRACGRSLVPSGQFTSLRPTKDSHPRTLYLNCGAQPRLHGPPRGAAPTFHCEVVPYEPPCSTGYYSLMPFGRHEKPPRPMGVPIGGGGVFEQGRGGVTPLRR